MSRFRTALAVLAASLLSAGATAAPITLGFDDVGLVHGSVVSDQYAALGVTISAINESAGPDLAVGFDSSLSGTRDTDLEAGANPWSGGNLAGDVENGFLGIMLIVQENSNGCAMDGVCDDPDDEGSRPAGTLIFEFDTPVTSFGFTLVDVDDLGLENGSIEFFSGATSLEIPTSVFLSGYTVGNNTANAVAPFSVNVGPLADLAADSFDRVELHLGGSGAVDDVTFTFVPEPSTAGLLALGLGTLAVRRRARA